MNCTLKPQCSSALFRSISLKLKFFNNNYVCGHCLRKHIIFSMKSKEREFSTCASTLRLLLKRRKNSSLAHNSEEKNNRIVDKDRTFTHLMKTPNRASGNTRMNVHQIKPSEIKVFARNCDSNLQKFQISKKCIYDSTRSYDPTLLIPCNGVVKFVEELLEKDTDSSKNKVPKNKNKSDCDTKICNASKSTIVSSTKNNYESIPSNKSRLKSDIKLSDLKSNTENNILESVKKSTSGKLIEGFKYSIEKSFNNGQVLHNKPDPQSNLKKKLQKLAENPKVNDLIDNSEKVNSKPKSINDIQIDTSLKEYNLIKLLQASVDVALNSNFEKYGLQVLKMCRNKVQWKDCVRKIHIPDIYNQLMHSFAEDWTTVNKIRNWMIFDGVQFNYQTYAALLDSLERTKGKGYLTNEEWQMEVTETVRAIQGKGLGLNGLFAKTILNKTQCDNISKIIRNNVNNFEATPIKIELNYNCNLLEDLYTKQGKLESQMKNQISLTALKSLINEQLEIEKKTMITVDAIKLNNTSTSVLEEKKKLDELKRNWRNQIREGFVQSLKINEIYNEKSKFTFNLYIYLKCLPVDVYVDAMMQAVQSLIEYSGGYSPSLKVLYRILGDKIHQRYQIKKKDVSGIVHNTEKIMSKFCDWYLDPVGPAKNSRQHWQMLVQEYSDGYPVNIREVIWPDSLKVALGKYLYEIIFKEIRITSQKDNNKNHIPVFYSVLKRDTKGSTAEFKCHPFVTRLFQKCGFDTINFDATQVPMLCPPKPWKSVNHGGYLISSVEYVRSNREIGAKKLDFKKVLAQKLYPTFDALNSLQSVPWIVNQPVLDVVLTIFRDGGSKELNVPVYPDMNSVLGKTTPDMLPGQCVSPYTKRKQLMQELQNQYGLWCEALYRLSLANHYRNRIFWLPQNFDFRGRVYPVSPHLNHIGSDLFRSLLVFARGKPLGKKGLDWLKIHAINLAGTHKKVSINERLNYANQILPEILDSADRPLSGRKWWTTSEEQWQTLAVCMEIKKAMETNNPELYICHFPIHQDGSCNGLQHYAALGRDEIGARSVNLTPCNEPQDVYSVVTQFIEDHRAKDAEKGIQIAQILEGYVRRKVVKQTIMTTVYGVTRYGARLQIAGQLESISDFPQEHVWAAAEYLTAKAFLSLEHMFKSAKQIQDWFIQCATAISNQRDYVHWVSPLGLPILQPYSRKVSKEEINKGLSRNKPNIMKQKNAFPPNFVHSLDSTHMMLTSLYCEQANVTFASIHDCFWTHPCSVDTMNKICREQFISLHSQSILKDLSKFFTECYAQSNSDDLKALNIFKSVPQTGKFDVKKVNDSVYFFS